MLKERMNGRETVAYFRGFTVVVSPQPESGRACEHQCKGHTFSRRRCNGCMWPNRVGRVLSIERKTFGLSVARWSS